MLDLRPTKMTNMFMSTPPPTYLSSSLAYMNLYILLNLVDFLPLLDYLLGHLWSGVNLTPNLKLQYFSKSFLGESK